MKKFSTRIMWKFNTTLFIREAFADLEKNRMKENYTGEKFGYLAPKEKDKVR